MRYEYTHSIKCERTGIVIAHDIDCEVEVSVEFNGDTPDVSVDAVYIGETNLFSGDTLAKMIAAQIADAWVDDDANIDRLYEDEGIVYRGMGENDPDGHYVREAR